MSDRERLARWAVTCLQAAAIASFFASVALAMGFDLLALGLLVAVSLNAREVTMVCIYLRRQA